MDCIKRLGIVTILGMGILAGCSKSTGPNDATTATATANSGSASNDVPVITQQTDPNTNPIAKATYDFLDAVLKGDTQRASARLTPQAMQRIVQSGKGFSPPGLETATFKIGEIRTPSQDQAIAQCVLTDTTEGNTHSEEMCCLLRKVENDWRVSGIAYGTTPDKPWTLSDFESGQNMAIPRPGQPTGGMANNPNPANGNQQPGGTVQASATAPPMAAPAPVGMPPVAAPNANQQSPNSVGLGMPAVGAPVQGGVPNQYPSPYTAQQPQGADRR